jgi:hypothetical protein
MLVSPPILQNFTLCSYGFGTIISNLRTYRFGLKNWSNFMYTLHFLLCASSTTRGVELGLSHGNLNTQTRSLHLVQELEQGMQNFVRKKLGPKLVFSCSLSNNWNWADSSRN